MLAEESDRPYQRPPLSKDYLAAGKEPVPLPLRPEKFFTNKNVEPASACTSLAIDRAQRNVTLNEGSTLAIRHLVLPPAPATAN